MSARFVPVSWTPAKLVYDAVLVAAVLLYLGLYLWVAPSLADPRMPIDGPTLTMRAYGSCAFLLLTLALAIGPLARLDPRLLPLLYNRRHLGVLTCLVALAHAQAVLGWYFAFSETPPLVAMLSSEPAGLRLPGIAFIPFGIAALLILVLLAATSHDFWLAFLGPPAWKALHMLIYAAYGCVVLHLAFGALQAAGSPVLGLVAIGSVGLLVTLHALAARREAAADAAVAPAWREAPWRVVGPPDAIWEGRGRVVHLPDAEPVAVFRHQGRLSAVSNLCAHQNGPLGEGRVIDGCITCPWHGFQYRLEDGCAPPPYSEKLATYRLRLADGLVLLDPRPNPPGTPVPPLVVS
jgi:nitrite reductase/ring-hydroxylating ferredoxin subunit/DMSO/TMAO reductase YedYZ heme-binding membrane subunit